ncbi:hypothetical protein [uncultured Sphingomonas sp.]|uniref:hypothetical protein n=1 Tax=uncultured Sphingomonas sp. TaxID=158754 RepID=UPI0025FF0A5E|nr:hypothetical protein [uncultured Sphingomonas sp.]
MLHLHDRASIAHALTLDVDPRLHTLLVEWVRSLTSADQDLTDDTEFLVIQPGDSEEDIIRCIGFSPLVEPIDGIHYGHAGFHPYWDWLADRGYGWFEIIVTFGGAFCRILLIQDEDGTLPELRRMCRDHVT